MTVAAAPPSRTTTTTTSVPSSTLLHSGMTVARYHSMHFLGALFPLTAGVMLYGWRAALAVAVVLGSAMVAASVWGRIGRRGRQIDRSHALWLALLLAMMLPAHLAGGRAGGRGADLWPVLVVAGAGLVVLLWLSGGLGVGRVHPVPVTFLLLAATFGADLVPQYVLQRQRLVAGDVLNAPRPGSPHDAGSQPWLQRVPENAQDAFWAEPAAERLVTYTTGRMTSDRGQVPLHELLRDRMPPLEDLIVGGSPGPVGAGSAVAVIIGGLFLLYRGLVDFRIPLLVTLAAYVALLVLPVPTVIREGAPHYRWLVMREPDVRWETALTFVNYELMAGPILFVAFFLATAPSVRPLGRRARVLYATLLGVACAAAQLYLSVAWGPYAALLAVALLAPPLDRWFRPRALV